MNDAEPPWWRTAVVYEIYIRSFADGDGDGVGDIAGIRSRLPHLARLGVDAVWITPWFRSPMADGGYDVADHCDIDPLFGTLAEADALVAEAHAAGIRVVLDVVPNHTSAEHPWFRAALAAAPGSAERARYWFRPGRGERGEDPPNDWQSVFGGPAWTRLPASGPDDEPEWYLHLFAPEQPDLDWTNPEVRAAFDDVLRFWFDRGVDGLRVDVAHGLAKDPRLTDLGPERVAQAAAQEATGTWTTEHPHWDRDEVHEVYRRWRAIADSYPQPRMFVAEAWRVREGGLGAYLRPDELHSAFNFAFLACPWDPDRLRRVVDEHLAEVTAVGAAPTWVLGSHDLTRVVTRFGAREDWTRRRLGGPSGRVDVELGTRRAMAAALLMLALPGSAYVYQGDELGLPEVDDLPEHALRDPIWRRTGGAVRGRDGCRVPLPWSATPPACGFSTAEPWLPQPPGWAELAAERQWSDPGSVLRLHRDAVAARRALLGRREHPFGWHDAGGRWAFDHGPLTCVVNFGRTEQALPPGELVLASGPLPAGRLPTDTAAWLRRDGT